MGILDEVGNKSNVHPEEVMADLRKWSNEIKATLLMIESNKPRTFL